MRSSASAWPDSRVHVCICITVLYLVLLWVIRFTSCLAWGFFFSLPELYYRQTLLNNCKGFVEGIFFFLRVSRTSRMRSPSAPRSQSISLGCQGSNKVPSSQLESNADWFQRVPLKNAKHARAVGLSVVPAPTQASFAQGLRNVTRSGAFTYITLGWLFWGETGAVWFWNRFSLQCSCDLFVFVAVCWLRAWGFIRARHRSPYRVTPLVIGIAGILTNALVKPSPLWFY